MTDHVSNDARTVPLRRIAPAAAAPGREAAPVPRPEAPHAAREPLWRHLVGDVLRRERVAQRRTLQHVADMARISMPYLSELERGRKEASSEVLAAIARALGLELADLLALAQSELAALVQARQARARAVTDLGPRRAGARVAPRQGDVRLAA